jgi:hypothetical protein
MIGRTSISSSLLVTVAATLATATHATLAAAPARIGNLVDKSNLTERDRGDIRQYAEFWGRQLNETAPSDVDEARGKLGDPLRAVRVGEVFRFEYSDAVVDHLAKVVKDGSPHAAVNALQILALLGTPASLDVILAHSSIEQEPDFGIRLWVAIGFPTAVRQNALPNNEINKALRDLGEAAASEARAAVNKRDDDKTRWLLLRRQFEAISSVKSQTSREVQVKVLRAVTEAMDTRQGPSDLMQATYRALLLMRNEYLDLPAADQERMGKSLAPVLCDLCTVAAAHWDNAQKDKTARESYGGAVHISENLLKMIDARVRPNQTGPRTELGPAWRNARKDQFTNDHDKWRTLLLGPPYYKSR